jgi:acyl-CoA thioester hydrolase
VRANQIAASLGVVPELPPTAYTKRLEIRWRDMDAFQHVNNAVYQTYLEEARDEWFLEVLGNGLLLNDFLLARCAVDYRSPLTQEDGDVNVELRLARVGSSSITTAERVFSARDGRLAAEAEAVLVHCDRATGKSRPLTDEIRTAFNRWLL